MAEHPDVARFRQAVAARGGASNADAVADVLADDVQWHGAPGGEAVGKDDVLDKWAAAGHGVTVSSVYGDGIHVVAFLAHSGDGGRTIDQAMVFHVQDGKASEAWSMPTDDGISTALERGEDVPEHPHMPVFRIAEDTRERNTFEPEDIERIEAFLREDVEWHGAGDIPGVKGRDQVIGLYQQFKAATGGSMQFTMQGKFLDDTHAASIVHLVATRADNPERKMDVMEVNLFHLDQDGKSYEFWGVPADQAEMDAFWLP